MRERRLRSRQTRARMALVAAVLWVAGFEVMPWIHVALHDEIGHHHHDASGAIVFETEHVDHAVADDDDLDNEIDEHAAHAHAEHSPAARELARTKLAGALEHGRHSLAHHDVAMQAPPPVVTTPLPVDRRPTFVIELGSIDPISLSPGRAVARGPPSVALA